MVMSSFWFIRDWFDIQYKWVAIGIGEKENFTKKTYLRLENKKFGGLFPEKNAVLLTSFFILN